ncbi:alpha/beta fold hydrolase [Amnibacterium sp.]|uniref:alpha/beta fold hydrolase n=1 Tax=Amnibacterium sp. TaxID=1872496 RepID=UPI00262E0555|nr:alpha/beta hydrolase [Amnibacterium sp.]MCU1472873.1 hydrolase [Amnibacterium sp.]
MVAYIDRPGSRIAYAVTGDPSEAPGVLVAHSFLASRQLEDEIGVFDWSPVTGLGRRLIRFDARGHGESTGEADADDYRWPALADDLLAVADTVATDEHPLDAIAESTGCGTLLWAVTREPQRFRRLVLVIPPTVRAERTEQAELYRAAAALIELRGAEAWTRLVDHFPSAPLLDRGGWSRARRIPVGLEVLPSVLRGAASSDLPDEETLAALPHETLVLAWTTDANHPTSSAEYLAGVLPHARLVVADDPEQVRGWGALAAAHLAG